MAAWVVMDRVTVFLQCQWPHESEKVALGALGALELGRGKGEGEEMWTRGALVTRREPLGNGLLQWILCR